MAYLSLQSDIDNYDNIIAVLAGDPNLQNIAKNSFRNGLIVKIVGIVESTIDNECANFIKNQSQQIIHDYILARVGKFTRGYKKSELSETLKLFNSAKNDNFISLLTDNEITTYNNYVINRHAIAHKNQNPTMTYEEVKNNVITVEKTLQAFASSIIL